MDVYDVTKNTLLHEILHFSNLDNQTTSAHNRSNVREVTDVVMSCSETVYPTKPPHQVLVPYFQRKKTLAELEVNYYRSQLEACNVCRSAKLVASTKAKLSPADMAKFTVGEIPNLEVDTKDLNTSSLSPYCRKRASGKLRELRAEIKEITTSRDASKTAQ